MAAQGLVTIARPQSALVGRVQGVIVRKARVRTRMMASKPTRKNEPTRAMYSGL